MKKIFSVFISLTLVGLVAIGLLEKNNQVQAAGSWCAVLEVNSGHAGCAGGDQSLPGLYKLDPTSNADAAGGSWIATGSASSAQLKSRLITLLNTYVAGSDTHQKIGAQYIEKDMAGGATDWLARLNLSNIVLSEEDFNTTADQANTAYDPATQTIQHYNEDQGSQAALILRDTSNANKVVYVIKWSCGNPLGNLSLPGIPLPTNSWVASPATSVSGTWTAPLASPTFTNKATVTKVGTITASYNFDVYGSWFGDGSRDGTTNYTGFTDHVQSFPTQSASLSKTNTVPSDSAHYGDYYCEYLNANPGGGGSGTSTASRKSTIQCIQLNAPVIINHAPTGSVSVKCNADGTGTATGTFVDLDGNTNGFVAVGTTNSTKNGSPHAWTIAASLVATAWAAKLYVQDIGPGGDNAYHFVGSANGAGCNKAPVGAIIGPVGTACETVHGYLYDPNTTTAKLNYYIYVNPPAGTPTSYPSAAAAPAITAGFRGPGLANLANPAGTPGTVPAGHGFNLDPLTTPQYNYKGDWSANTYWLYAKDSSTGALNYLDQVQQQPCATAVSDCTMTTFDPTALTLGSPTSFTVAAKIYQSATPPPTSAVFNITITGPSGKTYANIAGSPITGTNSTAGWQTTTAPLSFTPTVAGTYNISWTYYDQAPSCAAGKVGYKPYFTVSGGDIAAGPAFKNTTGVCTENTTTPAIIKGQNTGSTGGYSGAGAQLAALALGQITTFPSGQGNVVAGSTGVGVGPIPLSFANTNASNVNVAAGQYGGGFGLNGWCLSDYNGSVDTTAANTTGPIVSGTSATYNLTGPVTIPPLTLANGVKIIVKVNGDAYISGNITYAPYGSVIDTPQFQLLVSGNIYINNTVSELHGFYDAQPTATSPTGVTTKGEIYTCAPASSPTSDFGTCSVSPLTFVGAVAAAHINLERTSGNIGDGSGPAESFVFSPELWLAGLTPPTVGSGVGVWQSVTSLPPVL